MKIVVLALIALIGLSNGYLLPAPKNIDELSYSLLQASDDVAVILVYNKVQPIHPLFYRMFDFAADEANDLD